MSESAKDKKTDEGRDAFTYLREKLTEKYLADPLLLAEAVAGNRASELVVYGGWRLGDDDPTELTR
jgi:hypothetical protein